MNYKAVLFDMDGVIVASEQLHVAAFQATLKKYGYNLTHEQYKQFFAGRTDEAGFNLYFESIGKTADLALIMDEKAKQYLQLATNKLIPYPNIVEFIDNLIKKKIKLALVTSSLRVEAEITLKTFNLTDSFSVVITAEDIVHSKPNPEGYLKGAKILRIDPGECIVIEDAPKGVQAAKSAGMRVVAVTNTHTKDELKDATIIVDELLPGCIDSL